MTSLKSGVKIEKMEENYLELSRKVFSTLTPREEKIIRLRELEGYTLEMIGFKVNLTRQRIHQIETKIIRKLKHPSRSKYYKRVLKLADKDIWERLLKQQNAKNNLINPHKMRHLARGMRGIEDEKFSYLNFFIRIFDGGLRSWLVHNSRKYKRNLYTRGNLDKVKINQIINELLEKPISSKRLYKIFKKVYLPQKMIIDMHRLVMNLWREFHKENIDEKFFVYSCKNIFGLDNPDNWE